MIACHATLDRAHHLTTDLNLLRVLAAILETGGVTAAGARLHLSASAVSRALNRLRDAVDDPLFVQVGREFQPTPRALELRGPASEALATAEAILRPSAPLDVTAMQRTFTISADDSLTAGLAYALVDDLRARAPGIAMRFITDDAHDTALDTGRADIDIGVAPGRKHLRAEPLFTDRYVLAAVASGPIHHTRSLAAALRSSTYVDIARNHSLRTVLAAQLPAPAHTLEVPSYLAAAHILAANPDAAAVLPERFVQAFGTHLHLRARSLPASLPAVTISQSWHVRHDADEAHRWLRERISVISGAATSA